MVSPLGPRRNGSGFRPKARAVFSRGSRVGTEILDRQANYSPQEDIEKSMLRSVPVISHNQARVQSPGAGNRKDA